jgi:hypothetical protein
MNESGRFRARFSRHFRYGLSTIAALDLARDPSAAVRPPPLACDELERRHSSGQPSPIEIFSGNRPSARIQNPSQIFWALSAPLKRPPRRQVFLPTPMNPTIGRQARFSSRNNGPSSAVSLQGAVIHTIASRSPARFYPFGRAGLPHLRHPAPFSAIGGRGMRTPQKGAPAAFIARDGLPLPRTARSSSSSSASWA